MPARTNNSNNSKNSSKSTKNSSKSTKDETPSAPEELSPDSSKAADPITVGPEVHEDFVNPAHPEEENPEDHIGDELIDPWDSDTDNTEWSDVANDKKESS